MINLVFKLLVVIWKPTLVVLLHEIVFMRKNRIQKSKIIKTSEQISSGRCLSYSKILFTWLGNQNLNLINSVSGNFLKYNKLKSYVLRYV